MQKKGNKHTDLDVFSKIVKSKLEEHRLAVDENCWNEIDERLNNKRKNILLWTWLSGVAVVAAAITLLFVITPFNQQEMNYRVAEDIKSDSKENKYEEVHKYEQNDKTIIEKEDDVTTEVKKQEYTEKNELFVSQLSDNDNAHTDKTVIEKPVEEIIEKDIENKTKSNKTNNEKNDSSVKKEYNPYELNESSDNWVDKKKEKQNNWLVAAAVNSGGRSLSSEKNMLEYNYLKSADNYLESPNGDNSNANITEPVDSDIPEDIKTPNYLKVAESNSFSNVTHLPPLSVGLSVRKDFSNYFALETGVTYTFLSSKYENKGYQHLDATLNLHYIGIPLNAVVYFLNNSRWSLYMSAGGMAEKGLLSVYSENIYSNDKPEKNTTKDRIKGMQWSLSVAIGMSYNFYHDFSVYLEPDISYYLNNNQPLSARTENPLIIGINAGIRYRFN